MMDNLYIYNQAREVPNNALKQIMGGKLKGKSDINPQWRIEKLTEIYGPCGTGWYAEIADKQMVPVDDGEIAVFVDVDLYVVDPCLGEWSKPIRGTGGNMFVAKTKSGLELNDDCYKMAYTDALSVAAKMLGVAADVYFKTDRTKYSKDCDGNGQCADSENIMCPVCGKEIKEYRYKDKDGKTYAKTAKQVFEGAKMCMDCYHRQKEQSND